MSGSTTAQLVGLAVPTQAYRNWDHTYVVSNCGWTWRCWGNFTNGNPVCGRTGDSFLANCISKPRGTAGIDYGNTGVCHQTANRILTPAMVRVDSVNGYWISERIFGHYGTSGWPSKLLYCLLLPKSADDMTQFDHLDDQEVASISGKVRQMFEDRRDPPSMNDLLKYAGIDQKDREALDHMLRVNGIDDLDETKKLQLIKITRTTRDRQQQLSKRLSSNEIDRKTYLSSFRELAKIFMEENRNILGSMRFEAIYGRAGYDSDGLIDEDKFLGRSRSPQVDPE